jgi:peptide chain release factor 1
MIAKLEALEKQYHELSRLLADPALTSNQKKYRDAAKNHAELQAIVDSYQILKRVCEESESMKKMLKEEQDEDLLAMIRQELEELSNQKADCENQLRVLLLPKDPNDEKNVVLEIRAGTGGNEATLFAQEIFRMYTKYSEGRGWKVEVLSSNLSDVGGLKEVVAMIEGKKAYSWLKHESGVHRVQRVPETETQGRIHTSAVTVAILPEAEEVDAAIESKDLRIDTYCSSGPGGQSVNTTYSAVRITHIPTGEVVTCQDEKSQIKNKSKAMKVLRARLYDRARLEQQDEIAETRKSMVGSGDRSEKIRTYNFPQNRVTDHRLSLALYQLEKILEGDLDPFISALITHYRTEVLAHQEKSV